MVFLYNIGIFIYHLLIHVAAFFVPKARLFVHGRKHTFQHIDVIAHNMHHCVWIHVSSLGEFEQARPIMEEIKKRYPDDKILLTFFSPSGYEIRKNYKLADFVSYLPIDTAANARHFIHELKPRMAIFIKYDFWYHYLHHLSMHKIPVFLVSAIFRPKQIFFKRYGGLHRQMLHFFTHIFVQNVDSKRLLAKLDYKNVSVIQDTRFDRVYYIAKQAKPLNLVEEFKEDKLLLIAGSTWPVEEKMLIPFINDNVLNIKFIIAPHEIHESHIKNIEEQLKVSYIRFTKATDKNIKDKMVLIIDNMGMLSSLYQYGDMAYIGGGFGSGIHNTLEPATFGMPIIIGPKYKQFNEALEMVWLGGVFPIHTEKGLHDRILYLIQHPHKLQEAKEITRNYVRNNIGGTRKVLDYIFDELKLKLY